jgi:hypothetical protein
VSQFYGYASPGKARQENTDMRAKDLKTGDRIQITGMAGEGVPGYFILPETVRVFKKLAAARKRSVRICEIDEYGNPWYRCRFKKRNGKWEEHSLAVFDSDGNWRLVQRRSN